LLHPSGAFTEVVELLSALLVSRGEGVLISMIVGEVDTVLFVVGEGHWLTAAFVLYEFDGLEVSIDLVPVCFGRMVVAAEVEA
jgi:hypothetical protein